MPPVKIPYKRLSAFYLFYFATLGALLPYWGLYLKSRGLTALEIGTVMAWLSATKVVAPNLLGWLADYQGRRLAWIRLSCLLAATLFLGIFRAHDYWQLLAVTVAFGIFWSAALSQFEAVTLAHLAEQSRRYPWIRLWGSVGFIAAVLGLGWVLDRGGIGRLPSSLAILLSLIWAVAQLVPEPRPCCQRAQSASSWHSQLWRAQVIAFLVCVFLVQAAHGPYYVFYSIYLKSHQYSNFWIGGFWSVGVLAEIVLFLVLPVLLQRTSPRRLLLGGVGLGAVRWLVIGWGADHFWLLLAAQLLHAWTFGATHAAAMQLLGRYFALPHQGKGQALYSSLSFGLGSMAGSYAAGWFWDRFGAAMVFSGAAAVSLLALVIAWFWIKGQEEALSQ